MSTCHVWTGLGVGEPRAELDRPVRHRGDVVDREVEVELLAAGGHAGGWWSSMRPRPRAGLPSGPVSIA